MTWQVFFPIISRDKDLLSCQYAEIWCQRLFCDNWTTLAYQTAQENDNCAAVAVHTVYNHNVLLC